MGSVLCNKYKILKELNSKENIKTYLTRVEPIVKEITPKNKEEASLIRENLEIIKNEIKIYEEIEENGKFYIVIDNNDEIISRFDKLILSHNLKLKNEGCILNHSVTKDEILELFKLEKLMCKISFKKKVNNEIKEGKGIGFFSELNNFLFKYALFTTNHVLDEDDIKIGKEINFEYLKESSYVKQKILIDGKRRVYTSKDLNYTCIEIFESDGIQDYFKIDPIFNFNKASLNNSTIFILQYSNSNNELSFSHGKILSFEGDIIIHNASTDLCSSGCPIIRKCKENYIIGLHHGENEKGNKNLGTIIESILDDILSIINPSEITCLYKPKLNDKYIQLLHDYSINPYPWDDSSEEQFLYTKKKNTQIFEEKTDFYINGKKEKFTFKYNSKYNKEIKVKFKFKKIITDMSFMFYNCSSLISIDFSSFYSNEITDMKHAFDGCSSLQLINFSSFNTSKVGNMSCMFSTCSSLKNLNLSSFKTDNVVNMSFMFYHCSSLNSLDLSSFNSSKVRNMSDMFAGSSLKKHNIKYNKEDNNLSKIIEKL